MLFSMRKRVTVTARSVESSQFDGKRLLWIGWSSVCPATRNCRSVKPASAAATCAIASCPAFLRLALPESKSTSLGKEISMRPLRIRTDNLPASIIERSLSVSDW